MKHKLPAGKIAYSTSTADAQRAALQELRILSLGCPKPDVPEVRRKLTIMRATEATKENVTRILAIIRDSERFIPRRSRSPKPSFIDPEELQGLPKILWEAAP